MNPYLSGSRPFRERLLAALLGLLLVACNRATPPQAIALVMPAPAEFNIAVIEHKSVVNAPDPASSSGADSTDIALLRREHIASSGYFKYRLNGRGAYKVKLNVFTDGKFMEQSWERRYPADIRTQGQPLEGLDRGFILGAQAAAFTQGPVMLEITATDGAPRLAEFVAAYRRYLTTRLE
jgi:hypothetical protein